MYLKKVYFTAALISGLMLVGCGGDDPMDRGAVDAVDTSTPESAVMAGIKALRDDDISSFLKATIPAEQMSKMRSEYAESMNEPVSPSDAAEFEMQMAMLTGPDAEDTLMAQIEPQLAQMGPQLPFMIGMFRGMAMGEIQENPDMPEEQREKATQFVGAVFDWAESADLASPDKARKSVGIAAEAARDLDLQTLEQVRALSFDDAMGKAGTVVSAAKEVLEVYGLSVNDMLDSFEAETIETRGDEADVQVSFDLLGTTHTFPSTMVKVGDGWFSKDAMEESSNYASAGSDATGG